MRYLRLRFLWSIEKLNIVHYYNSLLVKKKTHTKSCIQFENEEK